MTNKPDVVYLKDYLPPNFWIDHVDLTVDLGEEKTTVSSTLQCRRNPEQSKKEPELPLVLQGEKLRLVSIQLDGKPLSSSDYHLTDETLTVLSPPDIFTLALMVEIHPEKNTELSGLYRSSNLFCTQCEPEGFRRITYYSDRPDVMATFTTTIIADKKRYPVLLSNGNCVGSGTVDVHRHWVKWEDPFKKPCYLFALVAGNLVALEDHFVTQTGRLITLKIFVEEANQDKCQHAMNALKKSMKWDEETYGREYDLDIYMIVAVNDFNMGAMENKGLNIFNTKYILARPETATDFDYQHIDAVVGHEYFHNWSGNRITCRDWFQLSLKEGLTVFREHHFSRDISESPVSLIENVRTLRGHQFAEDAGPMAHPVRPESYIEINNFYTATVYEKGAEVIRMLQTLLGAETFRRAMDVYFETFDGQAVTCDDFVSIMESVSKQDLSQFRLWYSQAGTPELEVQETYQASEKLYSLTLKQSCPPTPNQPEKKPLLIPIAIGLLDKQGKNYLTETRVVTLKSQSETFTFSDIPEKPVLSLLRGFSAPVKIKPFCTRETLAFLLAKDSDDFNRWDASQKLTESVLFNLVDDFQTKREMTVDPLWLKAIQSIIEDKQLNPALKAEILTLPSMSYLIDLKTPADIDALISARNFLKEQLVKNLKKQLLEQYHASIVSGPYRYSPKAVAARQLKTACLSLLAAVPDSDLIEICMNQWKTANNMTDALGALTALSSVDCKERTQMLEEFYTKWQEDTLVLDKWFKVQALSELPNTLEIVQSLMNHKAFEITNPNKVYSLIGAFSSGNFACFHDKSGKGYQFLADRVIQLDPLNPQVAARMMSAFTRWKRLDTERQALIQVQLERLKAIPNLSKDVYEVVAKCLA